MKANDEKIFKWSALGFMIFLALAGFIVGSVSLYFQLFKANDVAEIAQDIFLIIFCGFALAVIWKNRKE